MITVRVGRSAGEPHVLVEALVDSGADVSVLPSGITTRLALDHVADAEFDSFVEGVQISASARVVQVHLELADNVGRGNLQALEHDFVIGQEYILLGRDVLNLWRVTLDGPNLTGEISI